MANQQAMNTIFWKLPDPIQELFTKIMAHADFAFAGKAPISDIMIVQAAYMNLEMSGVFADDCIIWHKCDPLLITYDHLIAFFTECILDRTRVTAASAGYHMANSAVVAKAMELLTLKAQIVAVEKRLAQHCQLANVDNIRPPLPILLLL